MNDLPPNGNNSASTSADAAILNDSDLFGLLDDTQIEQCPELFDYKLDTSKLRCDDNYQGFDNNTGDSWIYPTNYPVRKYQYDITKVALLKNTLVSCL